MFTKILKQHAPSKEAFYCVVAPAWLEEFIWNEYYKTDDDFIVALSEVMAPIFKTVTDHGLILQIDDPAISHGWEETRRAPMNRQEYEKFIMHRVEALNAALEPIPEEKIRFHVCWGSWPGMHTDNLPLKHFVKPMLKVKAQAFSIESAKSTHRHEWKVWRDVVTIPSKRGLYIVISADVAAHARGTVAGKHAGAARHNISNDVIKVAGNKATSRSYWLGSATMTDELVKTNGKWLFTKRK